MVYVILPAYNEEDSIDTFFQSLDTTLTAAGISYRIIVCDDGSRDGTYKRLEQYSRRMPIEIMRHRYNRGLGETMRDLFERVVEVCADDDVILRLDCDDTHEPVYFERLIRKLQEGYDVVIASRFACGGGQEGVDNYRSFISFGATLFMRLFFNIKGLREYTCGFRAYRASIIKLALRVYKNSFIQLKGLGFTCTLEKLVKLKMLNARFAEIPFVLRYDKKKSPSKMIGSITTYGYFTMALLYHWPWGGWKSRYKRITRLLKNNADHRRSKEVLGK